MTIHQNRSDAGIGTYLYRFVSGQHMNGKRHTNSAFRYRGTRDLTDHGRASQWSHRAGWERAAFRVGYACVTLAFAYGYFTDRTVTVDSFMAGSMILLFVGIIRAKFIWMNRQHHKRIVRPLYQTITMITAINTIPIHHHAYGANHKRTLVIPRNYRDPKARIKLIVPQTWEGNAMLIRRVTDLFERKLGGDWDSIAHLNAWPPYVEFMPSPAPPKALTFAEMRAIMDAGKENEIIIGKGTHDRVLTIDLDSESPHVAISMGTGGGKSALLRVIVAYLIHHGVERIDIIDPKRVSHNWARGIPGVYIHRTMADQMKAVSDFRKRMEARYEELDANENARFPRHVLMIEEQNSFMEYAKIYWEDYRNAQPKDVRMTMPKRPPVIGDLAYILFQGRQAKMNVFSVFQRMSASASGGGDMRVNYGAKILARFDHQAWTMLVGTRPIPRSSRIPGRGRFILGDEDRELQMILISEADAKAYALAGIPAQSPVRFDALRDVPADNAGSDEPEAAMTLREMCDAGLVPVRYSAAKRARTRAGNAYPNGEPSPIGTLYRPSTVRAWHESHSRGSLANGKHVK